MNLPGHPGPFGKRGGLGLGVTGPAGLREHPLGLFGAEQVGVARQSQRPEADVRQRIAEQRLGGRSGCQPRGQKRGHGSGGDGQRRLGTEPDARGGGGHTTDRDGRAQRGQPRQDAAGHPQHGQGRHRQVLPAASEQPDDVADSRYTECDGDPGPACARSQVRLSERNSDQHHHQDEDPDSQQQRGHGRCAGGGCGIRAHGE